jgi:hypothetical protein
MSEHSEQCKVIKWFSLQYPDHHGCLFAIPNGTSLSGTAVQRKIQGSKKKAEGLKAGVSDLFLMKGHKGFHGLFIEMKDKGKTASSVSKAQREHIDLARERGYMADWCPGFESAKELIENYMKVPRG